jgi:hypothetical protein
MNHCGNRLVLSVCGSVASGGCSGPAKFSLGGGISRSANGAGRLGFGDGVGVDVVQVMFEELVFRAFELVSAWLMVAGVGFGLRA